MNDTTSGQVSLLYDYLTLAADTLSTTEQQGIPMSVAPLRMLLTLLEDVQDNLSYLVRCGG